MQTLPDQIIPLLLKRTRGIEMAPSEQKQWEEWVRTHQDIMHIIMTEKELKEDWQLFQQLNKEKSVFWNELRLHYLQQTGTLLEGDDLTDIVDLGMPIIKPVSKTSLLTGIAATGLILISIIVYFWLKASVPAIKIVRITDMQNEATSQPGGNKAFLTLANGARIVMIPAITGQLAEQGETKIIKQKNNHIVYQPSSNSQYTVTTLYNTFTTPMGNEYKVVLADGSSVWLNAGSTLRYPVALTGSERRVELNGEAYFEVTKNPARPFLVLANGTEVRVLGTKFNVQAYQKDTVVTTTLVEGSVQINKGHNSKHLQPKEQAIVWGGNIHVTRDVSVERALAWKEGYINLEGETIQSVMEQITRWYNVDVVYEGRPPAIDLESKIEKSKTLQQLIKDLETTKKVRFRLKGRKLIVMEP